MASNACIYVLYICYVRVHILTVFLNFYNAYFYICLQEIFVRLIFIHGPTLVTQYSVCCVYIYCHLPVCFRITEYECYSSFIRLCACIFIRKRYFLSILHVTGKLDTANRKIALRNVHSICVDNASLKTHEIKEIISRFIYAGAYIHLIYPSNFINTYVCVYIYIHAHTQTHTHTHTHLHTHLHTHTHTHTHLPY